MSARACGELADSELLLSLCREVPRAKPGADPRHVRLARAGDVDWEALLRLAAVHRVLPRVAERLRAPGAERLPDAAARWLRDFEAANAKRNLSHVLALSNLLADFGSEGLRAIPFKGPALAIAVHGRIGLRQFGDLDLLVAEEDFDTAERCLARCGYARLRCFSWESAHHHPGRGVHVDLHRGIVHPHFSLRFDFEALWARTRPIDLDGVEARCLAPRDRLWVLCTQLVNDWLGGQRQLGKIVDVDASVRSDSDIDWPQLLDELAGQDGLGIVLLGLALAQSVLDTPLPEPVQRRLDARPAIARLARDAPRTLFERDVATPDLASRLGAYLPLRERWSRRVRDSIEVARLRVDDGCAGRPDLPRLSRMLLHPALGPAWPLARYAKRLLRSR